VSADDIAAVGFHALTDETLQKRDFVILGPELLSYDDVCSSFQSFYHLPIQHDLLLTFT
jgi:hypothetical protein